jgi:NAD(P)H-hydrate epimerase
MMENAGRNLALLARRLLDSPDGDVQDRPIVALAGRGANGGGVLVAARHLLNWGAWVQVLCVDAPEHYEGPLAQQLAALRVMEAPLAWAEEGWELPPCDLVLDAILGNGLAGDPQGKARDLIQLANSSSAPVVSLDAPSGVDTEHGLVSTPHVRAAATLMLALPRQGLLVEPARSACGDLYLADISVPAALYARLGLAIPALFARDTIVRLNVVDGSAYID